MGQLIRALGAEAVERVIEAQGAGLARMPRPLMQLGARLLEASSSAS